MKQSSANVTYVHQDHLTGTALVTSDNGTVLGGTKYYPFGDCRNSQGNLGTDRLFTGQRLDDTGLYYYNSRYYDPTIGRFISADTFVPWSTGVDVISNSLTVNVIPAGLGSLNAPQGNYPVSTMEAPMNPQALNRYSYVLNNPLTYTDPYGWWTFGIGLNIFAGLGFVANSTTMLVIDDNLNVAVVQTTGGGGGSASLFGGVQFQWTLADTVEDLEGKSSQSGGSGGPGWSIGGEAVIGLEEETYFGLNVNLGFDLIPGEAHSTVDYSEVTTLGNLSTIFDGVTDWYDDYYDDGYYKDYWYDDYWYDDWWW